jgi:tellurite methyltransferase
MQDQPSQPLPVVSLDALRDLLVLRRGFRLIDLRPREAFVASHLPGASHLTMDEIDLPFLRPPRHRTLILTAETPSEAEEAARRLISAGYTACIIDSPMNRWPGPWESGAEHVPAWEPSPLVGRWAGQLPSGGAIDLACGSGRDAVYLAMHGAEVTAIDILPDALEQAALLARRHGVTLDLRKGDIENDPSCWAGPWGTIHVHRFLDRKTLPRLRERLREGGMLLYETFLEEQALSGRKPHNPAHLLKNGELLDAAKGLALVEYREGQTEEGDWTASLAARKGSDHEDR